MRQFQMMFLMLDNSFVEINECESTPCTNGGSCVDEVNRFKCKCASGYVGTTCDTGSKCKQLLYYVQIL